MRAQPLHISEGRPRPLDADTGSSTLDTLSRRSFGWDFDAEGRPHSRAEGGECG